MSTQSTSSIVSRLAVAVSAAALSLSATADNYKWDNNGGDNRMANGDNWYLDGSDPKEYALPTADNDAEVSADNSHLTLGDGESFAAKKFTFTNGSSTQYPVVDISGGTFTVSGDLNLGYWGRRSEFNVAGGDVTVKNILVGDYGSRYYNKFNVSSGSVTVQNELKLGTYEGKGDMTVSGGTVDALKVFVGNGNLSTVGGAEQYTSTLALTGGSMTAATMEVGNDTSAGGLVQVSGANALTVSGELKIGCADDAWAQVDILKGGSITTIGSLKIGDNVSSQHAVLNVAGGEVDAGTIFLGNQGSGSLYITDGGVVSANQIQRAQNAPSSGTYKVFLDDGKIVAKQGGGLFLASINNVTLGENGGIIDTAGNNVTLEACYSIDGSGSFTKKGEGTLTIKYDSYGIQCTYSAHGKIIVEKGTLKLPSNQTIYCEGVEVADGATLDRNGSEIIIVDKEVAYARWTNAAGDGNTANPLNWHVVTRYFNVEMGVSFEEAVAGIVPLANTPIIVHNAPGVPAFSGFTDVTLVVDENVCAEGYSRSAELKTVLNTVAAWYDPSDTGSLTINDGRVTAMANKGISGSPLNLGLRAPNKGGPALVTATGAFNGRQAVNFVNAASGFVSNEDFPALSANGPRTLFVVAQGNVGQLTMLSVAQRASGDEEGRSWLLAHGDARWDWGRAYQISYSNDGGNKWEQGKVEFNSVSNDKPYVFAGRTAEKEGVDYGREITSSAMDASGNTIGNTADYLMPPGKSGLSFSVYYGSFDAGGFAAETTGYQGEALIFTNALSNAEMDAVNAYLKEKWLDPLVVMPDFDSLVVNAQVDLGGTTRTFEKLSGSGSFVDGTVVLTGDLVVTVNSDGSVVAPRFDNLVLGQNARLVVNGARNLPTSRMTKILLFTSIDGEFASVVGDKNTKVKLSYDDDHIDARRNAGLFISLR